MMAGHLKPKNGGMYFLEKNSLHIPQKIYGLGVAYIPEDRNIDGLIGDMSVWENSIMTETNDPQVRSPLGWLNRNHCKNSAQLLCNTYDVRTQSLQQPARLLSGGNVQKLLLGRWLSRQPNF